MDFDPNSGKYCSPNTYFRANEYFVRAVRTGNESLPIAFEAALANDALRALRARVEQLADDYPRQQRPDLDPRLDKQLPWISRTLEEAVSALESGRDPFGNPITETQVSGGLQKLIQMVCDPGYLFAMDLGHPGIKVPLKDCMDDLEAMAQRIVETPTTVSPPSASKGIKTLTYPCSEQGIFLPDRHVNQAVEELLQEGEPGFCALGQEIHVLTEHPSLLWQQLFNRLQWCEGPVFDVVGSARARRACGCRSLLRGNRRRPSHRIRWWR